MNAAIGVDPSGMFQPVLKPVQTIAVASGKGGVGKSVVAVNLAVTLSRLGGRVMLLDADFSLGNIAALMNLRPTLTVRDVMAGECSLAEVLVDGPSGVMVVPSANGAIEMAHMSQIEHASLIGLFSDLGVDADTMIIDVPTGLSEAVTSYAQAAREVLLVVTDEPASLQDVFATIKALNEIGRVRRFRVVANRVESSRHGLDLYSKLATYVEKHVDVLLDYCGSIPQDNHMYKAVREGQILVDSYPRSAAAMALKKLAARVDRWPRPQSPGGHVEFFVERLVQAGIETG